MTTPKVQASVFKNRRTLMFVSYFLMIVNIPTLLNDFMKSKSSAARKIYETKGELFSFQKEEEEEKEISIIGD